MDFDDNAHRKLVYCYIDVRRATFDEDEAERLYRSGQGTSQLAKRYGLSHITINRRLKTRGVVLRGYGPQHLAALGKKKRKHQDILWDDDSWLRARYATKSTTEIAEELGDVSHMAIYRALTRFGIEIQRDEHASRANSTSPKAAAQRREKLGLRYSYLQRQLAWFLYHAGFTDIRQEEPFYTFNVDFYSPSQHLAFEADGSFHQIPEHQEHDRRRDRFLMARYDLPVIRFSTTEIRRLYRTV